MYSNDSQDVLPNNIPGTTPQDNFGGWVNGIMSEVAGNSDNTNYIFMMGGPNPAAGEPASATTIGAYTKNPGVYHCPADQSTAPIYSLTTFQNVPMPRCRSVSMNFAVGDKSTNGSHASTYNDYWPNFFKMGDFKIASKTWIFSDEHPDSINDGFQCTPNGDGEGTEWSDVPASYHVGACGYAFADGHSEIHQWMQTATDIPITGIGLGDPGGDPWPVPAPSPYTDINWVESRCSPALQGAKNQAPGL
jgi:prepilin-type processing-associated H-X9-DG protein